MNFKNCEHERAFQSLLWKSLKWLFFHSISSSFISLECQTVLLWSMTDWMEVEGWENEYRRQFHQQFTYNFYARRSKKRKKIQLSHKYLSTLSGSASVKAEHRMLMKLSPGVNFINVKCANFTYECAFVR